MSWVWRYEFDKKTYKLFSFQKNDINEYYPFIKNPSLLKFNAKYNIFKEGISPIWEDKQNSGRYSIILKNYTTNIDAIWKELLLWIFETSESQDNINNLKNINGIYLNVQDKGAKIDIWTAKDDKLIEKKLKDIMLMFRYNKNIYFTAFT